MCADDAPDVQEVDWDEWVMVSGDWWKSSFAEVDWAYSRRYHWTDTGFKLSYHPRPPHYHDLLFDSKGDYPNAVPAEAADVELNPTLLGVQAAASALGPYERNTEFDGAFDAFDGLFSLDVQLVLPEDATEEELKRGREQWEEQVDTLLGILRPTRPPPPQPKPGDARVWDLDSLDGPHYYPSDADIVDLTDSDVSMDSDPGPTTPQADKKSYAAVVFDERGPHSLHDGKVVSPSPAKPLNASALSFVPAYNSPDAMPSPPTPEAPYVSPTYEFHFPSLGSEVARTETRSLPPLQRDEQGFYTEIPLSSSQSRCSTPKRPPSGNFLNSPSSSRQSKTREIVDRIRHSTSSASRRNRKNKPSESSSTLRHATPADPPPSPENPEASEYDLEVVDGWITNVDNKAPGKGKEGWVQELFQTQRPPQPNHSRPQGKQTHKRSVSAATSSTNTSFTPATPSSVASNLSALPSPPPTITHFSVPQFYAFQQPYGSYVPGTYAVPTLMQSWQMVAPAPGGAYMMPPPLYPPVLSTYDARKSSSRHT